MPNATVRANARALPETIPHPDADLRALAAQFEAAFQAHRPFFMAPAPMKKLRPRPGALMRSRGRSSRCRRPT